MRKLIMTTALVAAIWCFPAQSINAQTFKEKFREVQKMALASSQSNSLADYISKLPGEDANSPLAQRYIKEQMLDDMLEIMAPYYEPYLTEEDIDFVRKEYEKPEVKTAVEHLNAISAGTNGGMMAMVSGPMMQLMSGKAAEPVALREGVSNEYFAACADYCRKVDAMSSINTVLDLVQNVPGDAMKAKVATLKEYLQDNIAAIFTNACYGKVTAADLAIMSALNDTPAWQHFKQGTQNLLKNTMNLGPAVKDKWEKYKKANAAN